MAGGNAYTPALGLSGDVYVPSDGVGGGTCLNTISGTNVTSQVQVNPDFFQGGASPLFDPFNGLVFVPDTGYTTLQAVNTTGTIGVVGFAYTGANPNPTTPLYDSDNQELFVSDTGDGSVSVISSICGDPVENGQGPLFCFSNAPTVTNQTLSTADNSLPEALGSHIFVVQIDSLFLATGRWNATSPTQATSASSSASISFQASGPDGMTGYAVIKMPKLLVALLLYGTTGGTTPNPAALRAIPSLYIDGQPTNVFSWQSDSQNFYLTFSVHFSTHNVTIVFTPVTSTLSTTVGTTTATAAPSSSTSSSPSSSSSAQGASSPQTIPSSDLIVGVAAIVLVVAVAIMVVRRRGGSGQKI